MVVCLCLSTGVCLLFFRNTVHVSQRSDLGCYAKSIIYNTVRILLVHSTSVP